MLGTGASQTPQASRMAHTLPEISLQLSFRAEQIVGLRFCANCPHLPAFGGKSAPSDPARKQWHASHYLQSTLAMLRIRCVLGLQTEQCGPSKDFGEPFKRLHMPFSVTPITSTNNCLWKPTLRRGHCNVLSQRNALVMCLERPATSCLPSTLQIQCKQMSMNV